MAAEEDGKLTLHEVIILTTEEPDQDLYDVLTRALKLYYFERDITKVAHAIVDQKRAFEGDFRPDTLQKRYPIAKGAKE